jgi:thiol-disulfide isomerase/thioredoxin
MRRAAAPVRSGIAILCLLAAVLPAAAQAPSRRAVPKAGDLAPAFSLQTLDGKTLTRENLKGKVVVLDFWATWCAHSVRAMPELKDLKKKNAAQPVVVVSVSVDDNKKAIEEFVRTHAMDWPQAWDPGMETTMSVFGVQSFPTYIVIGADGRIVTRAQGWTPGRTAAQVNGAVEKSLKEARKAPEAETAR